MRTEDIVGLSFFLLLFAGLGQILYGLRQTNAPLERKQWQRLGLLTIGLTLFTFGLLSAYLIRTSARPVIEGNICAVSNGGTEDQGSRFNVTVSTGKFVTIRCRYDGSGLREGDQARVRYVAYDQKLLELTMLTGSSTGWHLQEGDGEWGYGFWALMGLVCGFAGLRVGHGSPSQEPTAL